MSGVSAAKDRCNALVRVVGTRYRAGFLSF